MKCEVCRGAEEKKLMVYEDEHIIAALAPKPASLGHILISTKKHFTIMEEVPEELVGKAFVAANKLSTVLFGSFDIQGTNIFVMNGKAAGQRYPHFTISLIPRKTDDSLSLEWEPKQLSDEEMSQIESRLSEKDAPDAVSGSHEGGAVAASSASAAGSAAADKADEGMPEKTIREPDREKNYLIEQLRRRP